MAFSTCSGIFKGRSRGSLFKISKRGFAENPNDIAKRIASTKSIQKITKSMKMVSAAKLRGDTQRLMEGRPFGKGMAQLLNPLEWFEEDKRIEFKKPLYVLMTTDRGLCGGVNSYVAKMVKAQIEEDIKAGMDPKIVVVGDKGGPLMQRTYGQRVVLSIVEPWKIPMNFPKALAIADRIAAVGNAEGSDVVRICYNKFLNSIKYDTGFKDMPMFTTIVGPEEEMDELPAPLNRYEMEYDNGGEGVANLMEYALAIQVYACAIENATSEQSSRMSAMDNASKNAGELVDSLTVKFNRARQAKITTELSEIISGAESLKG